MKLVIGLCLAVSLVSNVRAENKPEFSQDDLIGFFSLYTQYADRKSSSEARQAVCDWVVMTYPDKPEMASAPCKTAAAYQRDVANYLKDMYAQYPELTRLVDLPK